VHAYQKQKMNVQMQCNKQLKKHMKIMMMSIQK